ncbi:MAG: tetratricopeptide repeat protein, partial [Phycisphaerae bacterium]
MAIRTKTKRRLLVLLIVVVAVVAAAGGIYTLRMRQIREEIARKRTEGMAAFEKGDYFSALHALGTYVNRSGEPDVEVLYKYSQARQKVEEPNAKHLLLAAGTLRHVLGLKPDHVQARRDLLDIYDQLGYSTEAIETADHILKNHPDDPQALRAKAIALTRLRKLNEALELLERYNKLKPLELDGHTLTFSIMRSLERPARDLIARAEGLHKAHPGDPRMEWLMAYAYGLAGDREKEAKWCRAAAGHDDLEPEVVIRIVGLLDHLGEPQKAFELLKRAADTHDDRQIQRSLAKRLWENQDFGQLIERFSDPNAPAAEADSEVLGLLALSLIKAGRQEDAGPFVDALS